MHIVVSLSFQSSTFPCSSSPNLHSPSLRSLLSSIPGCSILVLSQSHHMNHAEISNSSLSWSSCFVIHQNIELGYRYQYIIMVMAEVNTTWLSHTNISRNFEPWSSTLTILNFRELRISSRYTSSYPQLLDLTQLHTTFFFFKVCIKRQCKMPKYALI